MNFGEYPDIAVVGAGFIGRHLVRASLTHGCRVRVLDRNPCPAEFQDSVQWIQGNFHDPGALQQVLAGANVAYHLVSSTVPGDRQVNVAAELHDNVVGSLNFVDACTRLSVERLVFASSASVYGVQDAFPIAEAAPTNPISAHGVHKLTVEKFLLMALREKGLDVRILRLANPYGPGQSLQGRQGIVAIAIGCLLRGEALTLREAGSMVRDFIFVGDLASAMMQVGIMPGLPPVINLGAGAGHSLRQLVDFLEELSGRALEVLDAPARLVDIPISVLDVGLARRVLNFDPATSLRCGLAQTLQHHGLQPGKC